MAAVVYSPLCDVDRAAYIAYLAGTVLVHNGASAGDVAAIDGADGVREGGCGGVGDGGLALRVFCQAFGGEAGSLARLAAGSSVGCSAGDDVGFTGGDSGGGAREDVGVASGHAGDSERCLDSGDGARIGFAGRDDIGGSSGAATAGTSGVVSDALGVTVGANTLRNRQWREEKKKRKQVKKVNQPWRGARRQTSVVGKKVETVLSDSGRDSCPGLSLDGSSVGGSVSSLDAELHGTLVERRILENRLAIQRAKAKLRYEEDEAYIAMQMDAHRSQLVKKSE